MFIVSFSCYFISSPTGLQIYMYTKCKNHYCYWKKIQIKREEEREEKHTSIYSRPCHGKTEEKNKWHLFLYWTQNWKSNKNRSIHFLWIQFEHVFMRQCALLEDSSCGKSHNSVKRTKSRWEACSNSFNVMCHYYYYYRRIQQNELFIWWKALLGNNLYTQRNVFVWMCIKIIWNQTHDSYRFIFWEKFFQIKCLLIAQSKCSHSKWFNRGKVRGFI